MNQDESLREALKSKIKSLDKYAWNGKIKWQHVQKWLDNFNDCQYEYAHINMLYLLGQFMYFGEKEVRELLTSLFRDKIKYQLISDIRHKKPHSDFDDIDLELRRTLTNTRFLGVGNPAESGTHLLYYFRQQNKLPKNLFINGHEIFSRNGKEYSLKDPNIEHYVFIDDFCGSGSQACDYSKSIVANIKSYNPTAKVHYSVLFALEDGLKTVKANSNYDFVNAVCELDESFKCFSKNSRHFKAIEDKVELNQSETHKICRDYGQIILKGHPELENHPLGWNCGQLLIGFYHNTPDNTLPVFWSNGSKDNPWSPIFKRYDKIYRPLIKESEYE